MANVLKGKAAEQILSRLKAANLKGLFTLGRSIKGKLLFWLLLISLVPMAVIALFSWRYSASALQQQSFENLETTLAFQHQALHQYFTEQEKTLKNISETMQLLQNEAHIKLAAVRDLQKKQIIDYFQMRYQNTQAFANNPEQKKMFTGLIKDASTEMDSAFAEYLTNWLEQRDFSALVLLSPDGKVLYSTDKDMPRGEAVKEKTAEWNALQKGIQETAFIDYSPSSFHAEHADKMVAYFSTPFTVEGKLEGVLLFGLKGNALDDITKNPPGLGDKGESYLVGVDGMFRSNSAYFAEPTLANPAFVVDTESVVYALSGESGEETTNNYRGDYVLSSYTSVEIYGTTWVLIVDLDQADAVAPKRKVADKETDHLSELAAHYGFPDLYLINPDGYIFYSAKKQSDFLTNMLSGPYKDTNFGGTVAKAVTSKEIAISDYNFYAPAGDKPAAFLVAPILSNKQEIIMLAALQIPIDQINAVMNIRSRFEEGTKHEHEEGLLIADTYLIGSDNLWRSESSNAKKYGVEKTLLNPKAKVATEAVTEALSGKDNTKIIVNGAGESVLSSWAQFKYKDLTWAIISEVSEEAVHQPVTNLLKIIGVTVLSAAALIAVVSLLVAGGVTRQVKEIVQVMSKVEKGDYSVQAKVTSKDELGRLAGDFNTMTGTIQNLIQTRQEEHDKLNSSIIQLLEEITQLADGDLTIRATVTDDVIGTLADSLNMMLDELGRAFRRIKDSAEQVGSTANVLSSSTGELADQNNTQSQLLNEAVQKISLLTAEIRSAAEKAGQSAGTSKISSQVAEDGATAVRETSHSMEAIRSNVQNTARAIKRLGESSQEISDFARTINEISDRTSILALNASIQAAAAGEEGRGFAVVAEEIQRLAERAAVSTRQIETLIRNILGEITEAGVSMDASIQEVVQGTKLSQNALAKLEEITARSNEVAELIEGVASASKEQADTTAALASKMTDIGRVSLETAQETMGASISMREMAAMGDDMVQAVAVFKLEKESR